MHEVCEQSWEHAGAHVNCAIMAMLYIHSIGNQLHNMMAEFKMCDSVPNARHSHVCNVLGLWKISLIPTCRAYQPYDNTD